MIDETVLPFNLETAFTTWLIPVSAAAVLIIGYLYMVIAKPYERSDAPAGDAINIHK